MENNGKCGREDWKRLKRMYLDNREYHSGQNMQRRSETNNEGRRIFIAGIERKQLIRHGHVESMCDEWLTKVTLKWIYLLFMFSSRNIL